MQPASPHCLCNLLLPPPAARRRVAELKDQGVQPKDGQSLLQMASECGAARLAAVLLVRAMAPAHGAKHACLQLALRHRQHVSAWHWSPLLQWPSGAQCQVRQAQSDIDLPCTRPSYPTLVWSGLAACMPHPGCQGKLAAHASLPFYAHPLTPAPFSEEKKKGFKPGVQGTPGGASGESSDE